MRFSLPLFFILLLAPLAALHAAEPVVIDLNQRTWQGRTTGSGRTLPEV
jgi:hypothetical protein